MCDKKKDTVGTGKSLYRGLYHKDSRMPPSVFGFTIRKNILESTAYLLQLASKTILMNGMENLCKHQLSSQSSVCLVVLCHFGLQ